MAGLAALNPKQLNALYNHLLKPVESMIADSDSIFVVADGPLYTQSFAMLVRRYGESEKAAFKRAHRRTTSPDVPLFGGFATLDFAARY